jgi:hypothetical protein
MASSLPACPISVDDSFGPWAGQDCRGGFDFTLLFEESILSIPLQCIFLIVLPVRVWQLAKSDRKVKASTQRTFKAVSRPNIRRPKNTLCGQLTGSPVHMPLPPGSQRRTACLLD